MRSITIPSTNLTYKMFKRFYSVRVRFAPSPTGFLHLGGLRTALYNFLFAKARNGAFILRIEDTDQSRLVPGAVEQLHRDLKWAGINIDEGPQNQGLHGPYVQSQRLDIYRKHVNLLLNTGSAYRCFCSEKRLDLLRKEAARAREVMKYDNRCRSLTPTEVDKKIANGQQSCIRFKLSSDVTSFNDLIFGDITYDVSSNEGDPVIMKTDGYPTYHFANVVDDHLMEITHVLRGVEWQISTTKHLLMYKAFKWKPPQFAHLPLLMNADGTKLSKRQNDIKISHYRDKGIFSLALINFIVNSGGGFEKDLQRNVKPKCFTIAELSEQFDISRINSHSGRLMSERLKEFNKLDLNRQLNNEQEAKILIDSTRKMVKDYFDGQTDLRLDDKYIKQILDWSSDRINKLSDLLSDNLRFIWVSPNVKIINDKDKVILTLFATGLQNKNFQRESLAVYFKEFCADHNVKFGGFMKSLRGIISGLKEGPSVAEMMEILGKKTILERLDQHLK